MRHAALAEKVAGLTEPCWENELLEVAFPEFALGRADALGLFRHHFVLFHALYRRQHEMAAAGKYLHIHVMRTFWQYLPPLGVCRAVDPATGAFCGLVAEDAGTLCRAHGAREEETALDLLSITHFYLDRRNFFQLDEQTAEAFLRGGKGLLQHGTDLPAAFAALGLAPTNDQAAIRRAFRLGARRCHPDAGGVSADEFCRLNRAYRLLMQVIPQVGAFPTSNSTE
jgi:hypothetical protein